MTINEAIEILTKGLPADTWVMKPDLQRAAKLGIEALRQIKQIRVYAKELYLPLLPGETKE
ncbi:hypothetical protein ES708_29696 [subsurface metagenome]